MPMTGPSGSSGPIADHAAALDRAMKSLRKTMKGIRVRTAGFKKDHDALAKAVAEFSVLLIEAEALQRSNSNRSGNRSRNRTRGGANRTAA